MSRGPAGSAGADGIKYTDRKRMGGDVMENEIEPAAEEIQIDREPDLEKWEAERLIIHRNTFRRIRAVAGKYADSAFMLYAFYMDKGKKDGTNQPWANDRYCMKGLGWTKDRFYQCKKILIDAGFIEPVVVAERDEHGQFQKGKKKNYIRVNYMNRPRKPKSPENRTPGVQESGKPDIRKNLLSGNPPTNAFYNKIQMLIKNNNNDAVVVFLKSLGIAEAEIMEAGLHDLKKSLLIMADQAEKKKEAGQAVREPAGYLRGIIRKLKEEPESGGPLTQAKGSDDWGFDFMDETDAEAEKRKADEAQALEDMKSENVEEKLEALKQAVQDTGPAG